MRGFEGMSPIVVFAVQYAALLLCISIHESAHALSAYMLGDETSKQQNRISLNPLDHIDIFGTVIFPILAFIAHIPVIGWAKPVMVNPMNLRDPRRDGIFISAAGPGSNLFAAIALVAISPLLMPLLQSSAPVMGFYQYAVIINILLAIFNLIPIPPLDGSGIVAGFLPDQLAEKYERIDPFIGFILLYALMWTGALNFFLGIVNQLFMAINLAIGII